MPLFLLPLLSFLGGIPKQWLIYGGIALAVLAGVAYFHHAWTQQGHDQAIQEITHANDVEKQRADQAQQTVDQCFAGGGTWDRNTGQCVR